MLPITAGGLRSPSSQPGVKQRGDKDWTRRHMLDIWSGLSAVAALLASEEPRAERAGSEALVADGNAFVFAWFAWIETAFWHQRGR